MPIGFVIGIFAAVLVGIVGREKTHSDEVNGYKARDAEKRAEIRRLEFALFLAEAKRDELIARLGALDETVGRQNAAILIQKKQLAERKSELV